MKWGRSGRHGPVGETVPASADAIVLVVLTAVALALRLSQIDQTLAGDEVFTYQDVVGHSFSQVLSTVNSGGENSPPLFFALAWLTAKLGDPSVWIRLPSILLGTAAVPLTYAVGRESVGRVAGLIGAAVMAMAPFVVFYGIEARPYAALMFFIVASTLALLRAVRPGASRAWWGIYALAAAGAAYSHYTAVFVLAGQAIWSLWLARDRIRWPLLANLAVGVLYIPWLPQVRGKALAVIGALYPLGVHRVLTDLLRPIPGHPAAPLRAIPTLVGLAVFAAGLVAGLVALLWRRRRPDPTDRLDRGRERLAVLLALTLATPVGLLVYSLLVTDLWLPRGLSASVPAAALVVGALLGALPWGASVVAVIGTVVVLGAGTLRSFEPAYNRGPFRTVAAYLDLVADPQSPVALVSITGSLAVREEFSRPHRIVPTIASLWSSTPPNGLAYLMLDQAIDRAGRLGTPRHPRFRLIARRVYGGASATYVFVYRRDP